MNYVSKSIIFLIFQIILLPSSQAQFFLQDEANLFVDAAVKSRTIGIEIEFAGVPDEVTIKIIKKYFGGKISKLKEENVILALNTDRGLIKFKAEGDAWRFEGAGLEDKHDQQQKEDFKNAPREIVLPPLHYDDMFDVQALLTDLKAAGAQGTSPKLAVSLQANVQMGDLLASQKNVDDLVNLLRAYFAPQHLGQSRHVLNVPKNREEFLHDLSPGLMKKLMNPKYRPTARELYDDFLYRQSLELLGHKDAWRLPLSAVKSKLLKYGFEGIVQPVVKMSKLRVSSLLLQAFEDDPLSQKIIKSGWARPAPIAEFREYNNDFDIWGPVNMSLGVIRASQLFGFYDHDELVSQVTGIGEKDLERIRKGYKAGKRIVRYALQDPRYSPINSEDRAWLEKRSPRSTVIQLAAEEVGLQPLRLPKDSIIWHRRNIHRATILADHTPGLENDYIQQTMENKVFEAKAFALYAPGAMPDMVTLHDLAKGKKLNPAQAWDALNQYFPKGWVLKGAFDQASENIIVTDKIDIEDAMSKYIDGFEEYKKDIQIKHKGQDPEFIITELKEHPGYNGWKIQQLINNQDMAFAQERVEIITELRVEVLGGKVLGNGSTIDRYKYLYEWYGKGEPSHVTPAEIRQGEIFVQKVVDQLPPELSVMPFAFDVALLPDGQWTVIESNAGGNSGFLEENMKSSKMLIAYLENYPEFKKTLKGLLNSEEQLTWIKSHFKLFNMENTEMYYPDMKFTQNAIIDPEYPSVTPTNKKIRKGCRELLKAAAGT